MFENGTAKAALVVMAIIGMLVGAVGLTYGITSERVEDVEHSVKDVAADVRSVATRVTVLETNYQYIVRMLEKLVDD